MPSRRLDEAGANNSSTGLLVLLMRQTFSREGHNCHDRNIEAKPLIPSSGGEMTRSRSTMFVLDGLGARAV